MSKGRCRENKGRNRKRNRNRSKTGEGTRIGGGKMNRKE
jgi:hypothetical protein